MAWWVSAAFCQLIGPSASWAGVEVGAKDVGEEACPPVAVAAESSELRTATPVRIAGRAPYSADIRRMARPGPRLAGRW